MFLLYIIHIQQELCYCIPLIQGGTNDYLFLLYLRKIFTFMNSLYRFTINQNKMKTRVKKHTLQFCFIILIFNYIFCAVDLHQKYTFTKMLTYCISYQEYIIMLYVTEVREFGIINSYDIEMFLYFKPNYQ